MALSERPDSILCKPFGDLVAALEYARERIEQLELYKRSVANAFDSLRTATSARDKRILDLHARALELERQLAAVSGSLAELGALRAANAALNTRLGEAEQGRAATQARLAAAEAALLDSSVLEDRLQAQRGAIAAQKLSLETLAQQLASLAGANERLARTLASANQRLSLANSGAKTHDNRHAVQLALTAGLSASLADLLDGSLSQHDAEGRRGNIGACLRALGVLLRLTLLLPSMSADAVACLRQYALEKNDAGLYCAMSAMALALLGRVLRVILLGDRLFEPLVSGATESSTNFLLFTRPRISGVLLKIAEAFDNFEAKYEKLLDSPSLFSEVASYILQLVSGLTHTDVSDSADHHSMALLSPATLYALTGSGSLETQQSSKAVEESPTDARAVSILGLKSPETLMLRCLNLLREALTGEPYGLPAAFIVASEATHLCLDVLYASHMHGFASPAVLSVIASHTPMTSVISDAAPVSPAVEEEDPPLVPLKIPDLLVEIGLNFKLPHSYTVSTFFTRLQTAFSSFYGDAHTLYTAAETCSEYKLCKKDLEYLVHAGASAASPVGDTPREKPEMGDEFSSATTLDEGLASAKTQISNLEADIARKDRALQFLRGLTTHKSTLAASGLTSRRMRETDSVTDSAVSVDALAFSKVLSAANAHFHMGDTAKTTFLESSKVVIKDDANQPFKVICRELLGELYRQRLKNDITLADSISEMLQYRNHSHDNSMNWTDGEEVAAQSKRILSRIVGGAAKVCPNIEKQILSEFDAISDIEQFVIHRK